MVHFDMQFKWRQQVLSYIQLKGRGANFADLLDASCVQRVLRVNKASTAERSIQQKCIVGKER